MSWKRSNVIILKKPNKVDYYSHKSYRPISLTPHLGKVLEKIILDKLQYYYNVNTCFSSSQHGFTKKRSTTTALKQIVNTAIEYKTLG